jgi:hypothetical protein
VSLGYEEGKRSWQPRELAMVSDFLRDKGLLMNAQIRVRLGVPHPELLFHGITAEELRMLRVWQRWADAVVALPDKLILIEAKIRPRMGPLEALQVYSRLLQEDPSYTPEQKRNIEKWFVYAVEDPVLNGLAREMGIVPIRYEWRGLEGYLKLLAARERRAPLSARELFEEEEE